MEGQFSDDRAAMRTGVWRPHPLETVHEPLFFFHGEAVPRLHGRSAGLSGETQKVRHELFAIEQVPLCEFIQYFIHGVADLRVLIQMTHRRHLIGMTAEGLNLNTQLRKEFKI